MFKGLTYIKEYRCVKNAYRLPYNLTLRKFKYMQKNHIFQEKNNCPM